MSNQSIKRLHRMRSTSDSSGAGWNPPDKQPEVNSNAALEPEPLPHHAASGGWQPARGTMQESVNPSLIHPPATSASNAGSSGKLGARSAAGHRLQGEVRGFRERAEHEGNNVTRLVWTFRLERYQDGVRLDPIPVEMRGVSFTGFVNDGDTVALYDRGQEGTVVQAKQVYNVTSGTVVKAINPSLPLWVLIPLFIVMGLIFLGAVAIIFAGVASF